MYHKANDYKLKSLHSIPEQTKEIELVGCLNLKTIESFPQEVQSIALINLPNLRTLPPLPPHLETLCIIRCPSLQLNSFPPNLHQISWYGYTPYECPSLPDSIRRVDLLSELFPTLSVSETMITPEQIDGFNRKLIQQKMSLFLQRIGYELRLKAISPERVAKWIGPEDTPRWDLLDSILGLD